ncbi:Uncharacterised protein [Sphingobacterium daejeonense]|nr:Uncharacterised protein [Sphingobacterium daejeonense]
MAPKIIDKVALIHLSEKKVLSTLSKNKNKLYFSWREKRIRGIRFGMFEKRAFGRIEYSNFRKYR